MNRTPRLTAVSASSTLKKFARPGGAKGASRFFKTGKGEYGEGDLFLGVKVPDTRAVAHQFYELPIRDCKTLLRSKFHEERVLALLILLEKYERTDDEKVKAKIYRFCIQNLRYINNWDLVDTAAPNIIGPHLYERNRSILYKLAKSKVLWEKRVAIISTFYFIRQNDFNDTLKIAETLMNDDHDLIHKAVGWMLREVGNRNPEVGHRFLRRHQKKMPRTMLRYAIEKFSPRVRQAYLEGRAKK
jgi:3-methyladenine DNA glycosylase AlkD